MLVYVSEDAILNGFAGAVEAIAIDLVHHRRAG
jgi:hypothetical protein